MIYYKKWILNTVTMFMVTVFLTHCTSVRTTSSNLNGIRVTAEFPVQLPDASFQNALVSINIIYFEDLIILQEPSQTEQVKYQRDSLGNTDMRIQSGSLAYSYFISEKGKMYGVKFDSSTADGKKLLTDSVMKSKSLFTTDLFNQANDSLISESLGKAGDLTQVYVSKRKLDVSFPDSMYFYFTPWETKVDYSFSREKDIIDGKKLHKVVMIFDPIEGGSLPMNVPKRKVTFEIKKMNDFNKSEIDSVIEKYRNSQ
jgi:hypothetical protein